MIVYSVNVNRSDIDKIVLPKRDDTQFSIIDNGGSVVRLIGESGMVSPTRTIITVLL